ncbi:MAG: restriction endonuclease subunit S [Saprospiraceae bacterium]|nr:restriction endonuclease subunit S [Saprospiraceae bacterium]
MKFKDLANYEFLLPPKAEQARLAELLWDMDEVIEKEKVVLEKLNSCLIALEFLYFDNYKKVSLKQVVQKTISGGTPSTKEKDFYKNGTIPWITTKTLNEDYTFFGEKLISNEAVQNSAAKILPKGNILAGTRVGVGKFSINEVDISFSQDINGLFIEKSLANVEYLLFQLNSKVFQKKLEPLLRGTTIKGILKDDLLNLKICLPKIKIQTENAMVITKNKKSIFNLIEKITASQSLQKSLINQIF